MKRSRILAGAGTRLAPALALAFVTALGGCTQRRDGGSIGREDQDRPALHIVTMHGIRFDPESLVVAPGDSVRWENRDVVPHTTTAQDSAWNSGLIASGSSWSTTIAPGRHVYVCTVHTNMRAVVEAH